MIHVVHSVAACASYSAVGAACSGPCFPRLGGAQVAALAAEPQAVPVASDDVDGVQWVALAALRSLPGGSVLIACLNPFIMAVGKLQTPRRCSRAQLIKAHSDAVMHG